MSATARKQLGDDVGKFKDERMIECDAIRFCFCAIDALCSVLSV